MVRFVFGLFVFSLLSIQIFCLAVEPILYEPQSIFISSVITTPTEKESITLKNISNAVIDISGWTLGDKNDPTAYSIPDSTFLQSRQAITFSHTTLGFQINDVAEVIYLKNGGQLVDVWGKE
jgi:hypothetical protein